MALSTYWVSQNRKDLAERAIVAKREREASRARMCKEVATYHQELALKSSKYRSLESAQTLKTPRMHEESSVQEDLKAAEKEKIELRRHKLARILDIENDQYMKELEELKERERDKDPWNISKLKAQIEDLQRKRREAEHNMQKRYTHHMFSSSGTILKTKENEHLQREAMEAWKQRKEELDKLSLEKQQKEQEKLKKLELEKIQASQEARGVEVLQMQEQEKWSGLIQSKVNELNASESDTRKLKIEKQILVDHLEKLLSLQRKRETIRDIHRKAINRVRSVWQAKEKLRRMLIEVKHGLELDHKLLLTLSDLNNSVGEDTALALLNLDDVEKAKEKIEMQLALEKQRELEIQQLYHEEAANVWEKKSEEWILESIARDEIINKLIKSLVDQINQKIESNISEERKLITVKENYLREIDETIHKAKETSQSLMGKYEYFSDRASRINEELESINGAPIAEPTSSYQQQNLYPFS